MLFRPLFGAAFSFPLFREAVFTAHDFSHNPSVKLNGASEKTAKNAAISGSTNYVTHNNRKFHHFGFHLRYFTGTMKLSRDVYNFCKIIPRGAGETKYKRLRIW